MSLYAPQNTILPRRLLSEKELAQNLAISRRTAVSLRESGKLPFIRCGRQIRYDWGAVLSQLKRDTTAY